MAKPTFLRSLVLPGLFLLLCIAVIIVRRPDAVTNPQFFAEDGLYWYAQAYNLGFLKSFFIPSAGYLQIYPRIVAGISLLFSIYTAPLIFNLAAVLIQSLPILLLISIRFNRYSFKSRLFVILSYLLLSNTAETHINLTNSQWYLAVVAFMVVVGQKTNNRWWQVFDYLILIISGLSAPYAILLSPLLAIFKWFGRIDIDWKKVWIVWLTAAAQLVTFYFSHDTSMRNNLLSVLTIHDIYQIFYRQILWGLLVGPYGYSWIVARLPNFYETFFLVTTVMGVVALGYAFSRASLNIKLFALFGLVSFLASVISPTSDPPIEAARWPTVLFQGHGVRYWVLPMLSGLILLIANLKNDAKFLYKGISIFFLMSMILFEVKHYRHFHNFQYPPHPDTDYRQQVDEFLEMTKGEEKVFQINPAGWTMTLIRK